MTGTPLVVVGAAGTGRETLDIIEAINAETESESFHLIGVIDDFPSPVQLARLGDRGVTYLGTIDGWLSTTPPPANFVVAIATPTVRRKLASTLEAAGHEPTALVHPRAIIGSRVQIGAGTIIYGGAQVSTNVQLGKYAILNMNTCIGHDCTLGDHVSVNPGATVSGEVTLEDLVLVGGRATVLQGRTVGAGALVGAAALVTRDVPPDVTVKGIPGRW